MFYPNLHVIDPPLLRHKRTFLRNNEKSTTDFRRLVRDISFFLGYEAARDLDLTSQTVRTSLQETQGAILARPVSLIPVLRAGLGMLEAMLDIFPNVLVGFLGLYRNPETLATGFSEHEKS